MANPISDALRSMTDSVKGFVSKAMEPEYQEPGPGDVSASYDTKADAPTPGVERQAQLVTLKMSEDEYGEWQDRLKRARQRVKNQAELWDILLNEYLPIISKSGDAESVKVMQHFRNVHSKIGGMFYRSPDLILSPKSGPSALDEQMPNPMGMGPNGKPLPPLTMEDIVAVKQAVLQMKLGRDGIKINRLMDELLFDVLAWAGIAVAKMGYRCVFKEITRPKMGPPPMPVSTNPMIPPMPAPAGPPPMVPQMDPATGQPAMETIPVPVFEEWYFRRFSPKKWLCNDDLRSTRYDEDATWMGMEFFMSPKMAMRGFGLSEDEVKACTSDEFIFKHAGDESGARGLIHGVEIYCKASHFTDEVHPLAMNQLVFIEGLDRPVVWRPSPDQEFDKMTGELTKDSVTGFPYRVLTIRDIADSPFPKADSAFTNSEIKQLTTWRRQSIALRDAAIGKVLYDETIFADEKDQKALKAPEIRYIKVPDGSLANGPDRLVAVVSQLHQTPDDYRNQQIIQRDIDMTLGVSNNSAGVMEDTVRSATEISGAAQALQGRNDKELGRTVDYFLDAARMMDQLLMRYADADDYVLITGQGGARRMQMWNNKLISGKFLYDIAPDSMMHVDTASQFRMAVQHWNVTAKSPLTNQEYLLRRMARMMGYDPAKAVMPASSMPEPKDDRIKMSFTFNGMDLANPMVIALMLKMGIIEPGMDALNVPQQPEPPEGAADKADVISQHTASTSGGRENAPGSSNFRASQAGD